MPALFPDRSTVYDTPLSLFSTTMSFCATVQADNILIPDFFTIGGSLFQLITNIGDYIINYEFNEEGLPRISSTVVHFDTEEQFYFWRHDLTTPSFTPNNIIITVDISGATRAATDIRVYENGIEVNLLESIFGPGTATRPTSTSTTWKIGGTAETGPFATNGFRGLLQDVGIFSRILTPAEISQIGQGAPPQDFGASLAAPLVSAPTELISNSNLIREFEQTVTQDPFQPFQFSSFKSSDAITELALEALTATPSFSPLGPIRLVGPSGLVTPRLGPVRIF